MYKVYLVYKEYKEYKWYARDRLYKKSIDIESISGYGSTQVPKTQETKQVHFYVPVELWDRVVEFWHEQRLASQKAAVVALLEAGLEHAQKRATKGKRNAS